MKGASYTDSTGPDETGMMWTFFSAHSLTPPTGNVARDGGVASGKDAGSSGSGDGGGSAGGDRDLSLAMLLPLGLAALALRARRRR